MSSTGNIDAILSSVPADVLESLNSLEAELQDMGSFFDMESFSNDFGLLPEPIAPTNDALLDASGYSAGAFDASFDAFGHVDPYYATLTGAVDPTSVAPSSAVAGDILTAPPELPFYGDAYGVYNEVTHVWRGLSGQQTIYVQPPQVVQQQDFQLIQEVPPAQGEIVWGPEYVEPQAWQVPTTGSSYGQEWPGQQIFHGYPPQLSMEQTYPAIQDIPEDPEVHDGTVMVPEPVEPQVIAVQPPARPCKRKARQTDAEIWPERPKRTKCVHEDPHPSHLHAHPTSSPVSTSSSSSLPSSPSPSSPAFASSSSCGQSELKPIVVDPPVALYCPMPGCGVHLSHSDSAWRTHFRVHHHADLCAAARAGSCDGNCTYPCPLPQGHSVKCVRPMAVDSIGRHFLNIHYGIRHRCPVCGKEKTQRFSACQRHIWKCEKRPKAKAVKEQKEKSMKKQRGRKARQ